MGFLDRMKETAAAVGDKAKGAIDSAKAAYEEKKAAEEAHKAEMEALAASKSKEIIDAVMAYQNNGSFFKNVTKEELISFSKLFYDRVVLPASSVALTKLSMHPYIDKKKLDKIAAKNTDLPASETILMYMAVEGKQEIFLTENALYFNLTLEEDPKYFAKGRLPIEEISLLSTKVNGETLEFLCDEFVLGTFAADKVGKEDFTSLNNYFKCISEHDLEITDDEVDALIREKIGENILAEVKKYMIYDDEQFVYFAWGCNSLTAKDYIVCTNKQIIIVDREMGGMTANIKQLYYEDITSVNVIQNTNSGDLAVDLIANAITAATKTCDFEITVAGNVMKLTNLYKVEAERITAIYHDMKKQIKLGQSQPQTVVQQASQQESALEKLQKLSALKDAGILSEEEFAAKKAELLTQI